MTIKLKASGLPNLPLTLKGVGDGLWLTIDPLHPADYLVRHAEKVFKRLGHLTVNARVVLDSGDKETPDILLLKMEKFLKERFRVGTVTKAPPQKQTSSPATGKKVGSGVDGHRKIADLPQKSRNIIMAGRIRSGQRVVSENHLTIFGDVNPGAEVVAGGDILILGSLKGTALAGQPQNTSSIVMAFDFRPTQVQIGGYVAAGLPPLKDSRVEFACVRNGNIVVKDYLRENPFASMPFSVIRE